MSVVGSFLTIDYRQLFTLKKQSYIHQTAEHQLYFLLLLTAFNRTAYGIEIGRGIDIRCNTDGNRHKLVSALMKAGFTRIGIAKTYIHADDSPKHSQEIIWLY